MPEEVKTESKSKPTLRHEHSEVIELNTLGYNLKHRVPSTIAEFDRLAGVEGAAKKSAILNVEYRGTLAEFRDKFVNLLSNNTGIERPTEAVLKADGTPALDEDKEPKFRFVNTEAKDLALIFATLVKNGLEVEGQAERVTFASVEAAQAYFAPLAQSVLDGIPFDPSETERKPAGPKKVAKAYITLAQKAEANGKLPQKAAELAAKLGNWKVEATVDSYARAIAEDQRRQREQKNLADEYGVD